jgi:uncharacterized protein YecT (DUF1311 family)
MPFDLIGSRSVSSNQFLGRIIAAAIIGSFVWIRPAAAIDCAKAQTGIERAICSDVALKQKDAELAVQFFALLKSVTNKKGTSPERDTLLADQREWLRRREAKCSGSELGQLRECIVSSIELRRKQLNYEWGGLDEDKDVSKAKQMSVGGVTLVVGASCPDGITDYGLFYKGKAIACASHGLYFEPPFVVERRFKDASGDAALLVSHDGGQMNCSHNYVLSVDKQSELKVQKFGQSCFLPSGGQIDDCKSIQIVGHGDPCDDLPGSGAALRVGQGFEFRREASAASDGMVLHWDWKTGLSQKPITYAPNGGKTMADLVKADPKAYEEPLQNEEFYKAVTSLPSPDKADFMASLTGLGNGCDCAGPIDYSLYGLRNTPDVYALSGCGIYLEGYYVRCSGADALAVWDKQSGKFYFAIVHEGQNGKRQPPADVHVFPQIADWSANARAQFLDWQKNSRWKAK